MNLQENIQRIKEVMGIITETREGLMRYLLDSSYKITGIEWPQYVIRDWMYRNTKEVGDSNPEMYKGLISAFLKNFMEDYGKGYWEYRRLDVSIDIFTEFVQKDLKDKMGGYINPHIPNDEERHKTQSSQIEKVGVSPEPIILVQTPDGKYDLLEGWHRTTNALKKFGNYKQNAWVYVMEK
jgi:hypothetical protein